METLTMSVNGPDDAVSKISSNDSSEVGPILEDLDNIINNKSLPECALLGNDTSENIDESTKAGAMCSQKTQVEVDSPQNENDESPIIDKDNIKTVKGAKDSSQEQQNLFAHTVSSNNSVTEPSQESFPSHKNISLPVTGNATGQPNISHNSCLLSKDTKSIRKTANLSSTNEIDSSSTSIQHPVDKDKCLSSQSSHNPSASEHPSSEKSSHELISSIETVPDITISSETLETNKNTSCSSVLEMISVSVCSSTEISMTSHGSENITKSSCASTVQIVPCSETDKSCISEVISQIPGSSNSKVSLTSASEIPVSTSQVSCLPDAKVTVSPIMLSKESLEYKETDVLAKDSEKGLHCGVDGERKQNVENSRIGTIPAGCIEAAVDTQVEADDGALSKILGLKPKDTNEEKSSSNKRPSDANLDPVVSDSSNVSNIQILESSSITNEDLFTDEKMPCHEIEEQEESKISLSSSVCINNVNEVETTNTSITETVESCKSAEDVTLKTECDACEKEQLVCDPASLKADENSEINILTSRDVTLPLHAGDESKTDIDVKNETNTVILIEEEIDLKPTNTKVEKIAFKNILLTQGKASEITSSEKSSSKSVEEVVNKKEDSEIAGKITSEKLVHNRIGIENLETPTGEVKLENVRKRNASVEEEQTLKPKRTKMDEALNENPSERGLESNAMEVIDSDDDVLLTEDAVTKFEAFESDKVNAKGMVSEDVKTQDCKDEETFVNNNKDPTPTHLSSQVLQAFIAARIKAFIKKQKMHQISKLNKRITIMQSSTSLWKETAKHLERSVKEVTIINQGVEKRRAHVNACKKISSRTVGTQVNDDKVKSALSAVQNSLSNQIRENESITPNPALGPSVLLSPPTPQQQSHQRQLNFHQVYSQLVRAPVAPVQASAPSITPRHTRPLTQTPVRPPSMTQAPSEVVNLIDLTDDDEVSKKSSKAAHCLQSLPNNRNTASTSLAGVKSFSGNLNGFIPLGPDSTMLSNATTTPTQHHSVAGPKGQILTTSAAAGQAANRQNSKLTHLTNQPASPGNKMPSSRAPQMAPGKQMQEPPGSKSITMHTLPPSFFIQQQRHPAPLPQATGTETNPPNVRALKLPPKPTLKISRVSQGIVLSWNMPSLLGVEIITSYQLFAYQETDSAPKTSFWKKVGDVRALPLPMACTLTQFQEGNKYHFAVRAVDQYNRTGTFSDPSSIFLGIGSTNTKIALRG